MGRVLCFHDVLTVMVHDLLVRRESNVLMEAKVQNVRSRRV